VAIVPSVSVFVLGAELIPTNFVAKEAGSTKGEEIYYENATNRQSARHSDVGSSRASRNSCSFLFFLTTFLRRELLFRALPP
jgi:hypothetical protein